VREERSALRCSSSFRRSLWECLSRRRGFIMEEGEEGEEEGGGEGGFSSSSRGRR